MLTRKPVSPVRNKIAPTGWMSAVSLNCDEGTGASCANLSDVRTGAASDWDFAIEGSSYAWGVDPDEGPYVDLIASKCRWYAAAVTSFPRGTLILRFRPNNLASTWNAFSSGRPVSVNNAGEMRALWNTSAFAVQSVYDGALHLRPLGPLAADHTYTLVVTWGERGFKAWLDGVASPDNSDTPHGPLSIAATKYFSLGGLLSVDANMRLYGFDWLDWQIGDLDVRVLTADPHLLRRPLPPAGYLTQSQNPWACRPRPTAADFEFSGASSIPDTDFHVRVAYGTDPLLASPSYTLARQISVDDADGVFAITASGLAANTRHYWIAQWSTDGATWYPFPGGRGTLFPQRTDEQPWRYATYADLHTKTEHFGFDVVRESGGYLNYRAWAFAEDIRQHSEEYDFILDVGDNSYDADNEAWANWCNLLKVSGSVFAVPGNHENLAGWYQAVTDAELATKPRRSQAWQRWRRNAPNPHKDTYPQGVPWSAVPTEPAGVPYVSNVPWIPDIPADGGQWTPDGVTDPQLYFLNFLALKPFAGYPEMLGGQEDPHTNFAFEWGGGPYRTLIAGIDIYSCSVPGDLLHGDLRANANECSLSEETWGWLEGVLGSTAPHKHVVMHSLPDAGLETGTVWGGSGYYWRGSGVTLAGTEALRLKTLLESRAAVLINAHDHVHAVVKNGRLYSVKLPPAGSAYQFGMGSGTQATEQYGDHNAMGGDVPGLLSKRGCWGYVVIEPIAGRTMRLRLRQTACDSSSYADQSTADTFKMRFVGDELTVAGGAVVLGETPTDFLCTCDSADGTFVVGGGDPTLYTDYATANDYVHSASAGDGMPLVSHAPEPLASVVLDVSGTYADGTKIRVHHTPRTLYETEIRVGQSVEDWSSFAAAPNAYGRDTLVI